jgi:hypothetical protein
LGEVASDRFDDWTARYEERMRATRSPLTDEQRREIDRLIHESFDEIRRSADELRPQTEPGRGEQARNEPREEPWPPGARGQAEA